MYKVSINQGEPVSFEIQDQLISPSEGNTKTDIIRLRQGEFHVLVDGQSFVVQIDKIDRETKTMEGQINGKICTIQITDKMDSLLKSMGLENALVKKMNELKAPMPGLVLDVNVSVGDQVKKGDALLVLEAMKMENVIKSEGDGTVKEITVSAKDAVDKNQVLIRFE